MPEFTPGTGLKSASGDSFRVPDYRERRRQVRCEVDASATIFLIRVGSMLRGRIVDLSLGGCRIRTEERFHVGIYTRVETEFYLRGLPFRLGGVIQAIYDLNSFGVRFIDLSERKRQQLADLIAEMEKMGAPKNAADAAPDADPI